MKIHVSDIANRRRCDKYAWNVFHKISVSKPYFHMIQPYSTFWQKYLGVDSVPSGKTGDTNEDSLVLLSNNDIVLYPRLEYRNCRTAIPVLEKCEDGYHAIYPYLSCSPRETEIFKIKLNQLIAEKCGIEIVRHSVVYMNKEYIRGKSLDLNLLFCQSDSLFNKRNHPCKPIDECLSTIEVDLDVCIDETFSLLEKEQVEMPRTKNCTSGRRCSFYGHCFNDDVLEDDSILFLTTSQNKIEAYHNGIKRICDLPLENMEGSRLQYAQYWASKNGAFIDRVAMKHWLSNIQFPVSYLDFEWDTFGIPPYESMACFDVLCFQYSLHIESSDHMLQHKDYFGTGDCRKKFIENLLNDLPSEGTILVYNMNGGEKLRLVQLARQFPEYKKELESICDRMIDLSKPFEMGLYYDNRMRGHYSLKNLLGIFTDEVSYRQLSIRDGMDAVYMYRTFDQADADAQKRIRQDIRNYCKMDTYAEYILYHGLLKEINLEG